MDNDQLATADVSAAIGIGLESAVSMLFSWAQNCLMKLGKTCRGHLGYLRMAAWALDYRYVETWTKEAELWVRSENQIILANVLSARPIAIMHSESKSLNYWLDDADRQRLSQIVGEDISNCDCYH